MKRKLIAGAIGGLCAAPGAALAQVSTVQLYGVADASYEIARAKGGTAPTVAGAAVTEYRERGRIATNSSLIGFRGTEKLGGGLTAIFQVENQLSLDGVGFNNTQTMANGWNTRDTYVGMNGGFGQVLIGFLNPPRRALAAAYSLTPGATSDAGLLNWFGRVNVGAALNPLTAAGTTANTFGTTGGLPNNLGTIFRSQALQYATPTLAGFQARIHYTPEENRDNAAGPGGVRRSPKLWDAGLNYDAGPLSAKVTYTTFNDFTLNTLAAPATFGLTGAEDTNMWQVGASYTFAGATTVAVAYERIQLEYGQTPAVGGGDVEIRRNAWTIRARHLMGPHEIFLGYVRLGDNKVSGRAAAFVPAGSTFGDSGADVYSLRYGYNLSKRTQVFGVATVIRNERNGVFEINAISPLMPGGTGGGAGVVSAGADPRVFGIGLRHTF